MQERDHPDDKMKDKRGARELEKILHGKVVIVGVGNILKGDDGLGPALVERLRGMTKAVCVNAGNAPENYLGKIVKEEPDTLLFVDAVHLGLEPGEFRLLDADGLSHSALSTHDISAGMLLDVLKSELAGQIRLLGVQPASIGFGENISAPVDETLRQLENTIAAAMGCC
jgi:hydrogenase 3 maturation protease